MPTTVRAHPWWVAGLAALAAAATVCVLALTGAFDTNDPIVVESPPVVVVRPTTGGIDQANAQRQERQLQHGVAAAAAITSVGDTKGDLFASKPASQLGHGAAGYAGPSGDTKGDLTAGTPAAGQELVLGDRAAGH
jgi:hypothetical protein